MKTGYEFVEKTVIERTWELWPGLVVVAAVTGLATFLQTLPVFSTVLPLSGIVLAIIIGAIIRNSVGLPEIFQAGVKFASKKILRVAIIFLGFRLSLGELSAIGPIALLSVVVSSASTLLFSLWLGRRLGLPFKRVLLIGSGISVCGAAAIAAVNGVVEAKEEDVALSVGIITLFGTVFMFLYPVLFSILQLSGLFFALWSGSSIHEVAQVAAAAAAAGDHLKALATTVKMIRVLLIVPLTLLLSFGNWQSEDAPAQSPVSGKPSRRRIAVPWFALLFFVAVIANSLLPLGTATRGLLLGFDNLAMTAAMAGLGLELSVAAMARNGLKVSALGLAASLFISLVSALCAGLVLQVG